MRLGLAVILLVVFSLVAPITLTAAHTTLRNQAQTAQLLDDQGASITVNPTQGPAGSTVDFTISGFQSSLGNDQYVYVGWLENTSLFPGDAYVLPPYGTEVLTNDGVASGSIEVAFMAPGNRAVGADGADGDYPTAVTPFTITPAPSILILRPTSGRVGTDVVVAGNEYTPDGSVSVSFGSTSVANSTADSNGEMDVVFYVPSGASPGEYVITATDESSGLSTTASFTVIPSPTITLSPAHGPVGTKVDFTISNFAPSESVLVSFENVTLGVATMWGSVVQVETDSSGSAIGSFTVDPSILLPENIGMGGGYGTYTVLASSIPLSANASFTVTPAPTINPTLSLNPAEGPPLTVVNFTGTGYTPEGTVIIAYGPNMLANVTADQNGDIDGSFTIPKGIGELTIEAIDAVSHTEASRTFTAILNPAITLITPQGPAGSTLYFKVSGFYPDETVGVELARANISLTAGEAFVTTDATGSQYGAFTVPTDVPGTYPVDASDKYGLEASPASFLLIATGSSEATVSGNSVTADESAQTGVSVTVSGSSLPDGAQVTVTSTDYGSNSVPPSGSGTLLSVAGGLVDVLLGPFFYDVSVTSSSGPLGSDVNAVVTISNPNFVSSSVLYYWNGNIWVSVPTTFTAPHTVSCNIPASALTGTLIAVGTPKQSASSTTSWLNQIVQATSAVTRFGSLAFILVMAAAVVLILCAITLALKKSARKRSNPESGNKI